MAQRPLTPENHTALDPMWGDSCVLAEPDLSDHEVKQSDLTDLGNSSVISKFFQIFFPFLVCCLLVHLFHLLQFLFILFMALSYEGFYCLLLMSMHTYFGMTFWLRIEQFWSHSDLVCHQEVNTCKTILHNVITWSQ